MFAWQSVCNEVPKAYINNNLDNSLSVLMLTGSYLDLTNVDHARHINYKMMQLEKSSF